MRADLAALGVRLGWVAADEKEAPALAAVHERRQLIAALDRDAMLDVIRWGRRPIRQTHIFCRARNGITVRRFNGSNISAGAGRCLAAFFCRHCWQ